MKFSTKVWIIFLMVFILATATVMAAYRKHKAQLWYATVKAKLQRQQMQQEMYEGMNQEMEMQQSEQEMMWVE
jgi:predicted component of type VI protein secretion system